ncbi:MAG: hypothetical protein IPM39_03560 [Chloroflexi bacterium]|nr:hypothetical protein [Chloroflexota bacterium]
MNSPFLSNMSHAFGFFILLAVLGLLTGCRETAVSQPTTNEITLEALLDDAANQPVAKELREEDLPGRLAESGANEDDLENRPTEAVRLPVIPTPTPTPAPIRAIGVNYAHVSASRSEVPALQAYAAAVGVNMVGLNAGRPDWAYFRWQEHPEYWSSAVRSSSIDFLAEDTLNFRTGGLANVHINAMIDIYAPNYIAAHPETAAISYWGEASPLLVSTAALASGPFHDLVLEMIAAIAANYPVDSISITELSYRIYGYGPDDLALYRAHTGRDDWPRSRNGVILFEHPSIGEWRSAALAGFLAKAAAIAQAHGKELFFDVEVSWGDLANEGGEYGHDYATLLTAVNRIIVWGYTDLAGYPPAYAGEIATYLAERYQPEQIILSVGLWGPNGTVMAAEEMATAVAAIQTSAIPHVWITPTSLLTADHWEKLLPAAHD